MADIAIRQDPQLMATNPPLVVAADYHDLTEQISTIIEGDVFKTPLKYWITLSITGSIVLMLGAMLTYLVSTGIGVWGNNRPIGWAWDITNFVFWIGIGHAGTLISAILFLFRQKWRTSINRSAEAMTLFAVACAGIFPLFHTGRPWRAIYWLFPMPNTDLDLWQNFRSPLMWDVFAVSTYLTVSALFWYVGLVPDLATLRDRAMMAGKKIRQIVFHILSLGWRGSARHWRHYEMAYLILAGISTPLVLSVHTIVSFDFATSVIPGWHTTIFPPYFVAGAIFSGFAMVQTLLLVTRKVLHLEEYITLEHIDVMNKVIVLTGSIVGCAYLTELFVAWYGMNKFENWAFFQNRANAFSPLGWSYYIMMSCNVLSPQIFWFKKMRRNITVTFFMSVLINVGMWFERFVIIVTSIYRDYLPSSWSTYYSPTIWEIGFYMGTFGLFFTCYFLFAKFFPVIAIAEIKHILKKSGANYKEKMNVEENESVEEFAHEYAHQH